MWDIAGQNTINGLTGDFQNIDGQTGNDNAIKSFIESLGGDYSKYLTTFVPNVQSVTPSLGIMQELAGNVRKESIVNYFNTDSGVGGSVTYAINGDINLDNISDPRAFLEKLISMFDSTYNQVVLSNR